MERISLQLDAPEYLKTKEISKELLLFSEIIEEKYREIDFEFAFCFRVLYSLNGIKSKARFYKAENWLGLDLIMSEAEFKPYKDNVIKQRKIMGKYFFPFFEENIKKYAKKLPTLMPIAEDLIEDMRLLLIKNLWLPEESGSLKLSVLKNIPFERAMSLFGNPKQKKFINNENDQKVQSLVWKIDEKTTLSANYALIDKIWVLENYKIE